MLLERYKNNVQTVVHLGDNAQDLLQFQSAYSNINFVAVAGNCDFITSVPRERILSFSASDTSASSKSASLLRPAPDAWASSKSASLLRPARRVLLLHGHSLNVKSSYNRLMYYAQEKGVDACLFGHSHIPFVANYESVFFMNPGSVSQPRGLSRAGYGILSIVDDAITGEIHEL